jgi:hypothetical protein
MMAVVANTMQIRGNLYQISLDSFHSLNLNPHQKTDCARIAPCCVSEDLQERSGSRLDDLVDIANDEKQHNKEDQAGGDTNADTADHNLGTDDRGVRDF